MSTIKVDNIDSKDSTGDITVSRPLVATLTAGSINNLNNLLTPANASVTAAKMATTDTLPAWNGSALTNVVPADNSVTGGKLNISLLAGDTMYASGTDTLAKLAKGTSGQVLTMGANDPAWAAAAGGAWTAKSSGTLTTSSGLEVTGITGTTMIFLNLKQSAVHGSVILRTSSNGGSSYDSGNYDYYRSNWDLINSESDAEYNKGDLNRWLCHGAKGSSNPGGDGSNSTGEYIGMRVTIIRPQDSSHTQFLSEYAGIANSGGGDMGFHGHSGGYRKTAGVTNAFQIKAYSGTITGTYEIIHL